MKRILLFLITNIAVMFMLSMVVNLVFMLTGTTLEQVFGPQWSHLVVWAAVYGMGGAIVSLLLSKPLAKMSCGAKTVDGSEGEAERWLVDTVADLAGRAGVKTPEVAIYRGAANAFATGAFKNSALVAVSTDIMGQMSKEELRAVLGHEISHVANGDMVTLTLIQGVLNAFVIVVSRVLASVLSGSGKGGGRRGGAAYYPLVMVLQLVLGLLASLVVLWFSRRREYAADAGSAKLLGTPSSMIAALRRLGNLRPGVLPDSIKAMGIAGGSRTSVWATHPSLEDRIAALSALNNNWR
ncbi:MAG: protease HtpX [Kiritimatiellae bacterium]|nr:protease HtpX [Kiritimatiellia bacterium]